MVQKKYHIILIEEMIKTSQIVLYLLPARCSMSKDT